MARSADELLASSRAGLARLGPHEALAAQRAGAILVDIRSDGQIRAGGSIPGAIRIERNVLEWRADPAGQWRDERIADPSLWLVVVCEHGYQSSLAAANLQALGIARATDLDGGFEAWVAAGLPVQR